MHEKITKTLTDLTAVARTGFFVSATSYIVFFTLDWMRPGFVSNFMSVHIFLALAIVFGVWWSLSEQVKSSNRRFSVSLFLCSSALGLLLAFFAWKTGRAFGDFRILMSLVGLLTPIVLLGILKR